MGGEDNKFKEKEKIKQVMLTLKLIMEKRKTVKENDVVFPESIQLPWKVYKAVKYGGTRESFKLLNFFSLVTLPYLEALSSCNRSIL